MREQRYGFTLVEFAVSLAILILLAGIATPLMTQFLQNSRISGTANDILAAVNLARSEAIRRNTRVTLCGLDSSKSKCLSSVPGGSAANFEANGWAVFEDTFSGPSSSVVPSAPKLIRIQDAPAQGIYVRTTFGSITYGPMGQANVDNVHQDGAIKICKKTTSGDACDAGLNMRCIRVSSAGSPEVLVPKNSSTAANAVLTSGGGCY